MSKWRPEKWEEKLEFYIEGKYSCKEGIIYDFDEASFETGADAMLEKVREEIEKVENPNTFEFEEGFEDCRQKILTLLRSKKE